MDTKIRSDVRADPPSAWAFPAIKQSLEKTLQNNTTLHITTDFKLSLEGNIKVSSL